MPKNIAALFIALALALPAAAQTAPQQERALVVIRFNQPHVYYAQPLYGAISQAVGVKADVMFDVVSYAPTSGSSSDWQHTASQHTQEVVAQMEQMGVPASRIRVSGEHLDGIRYDEVHVFAR